ncbi:universal stress protein [Caldimonas tepidiphila]|uniref:universal stress protein n=1 Tax=Caldimonas tepidiphila TaxID=2315841 RepID=UPI000E5BE822|nr:universal stress protein [Caldimonas tepidiphila]
MNPIPPAAPAAESAAPAPSGTAAEQAHRGAAAGLRRLLVATDFSAAGERAVRRAAMLARAQDAALELLHVHEPPLPGSVWRSLQPLLADLGLAGDDAALGSRSRARLQAQCEALRQEFGIAVGAQLREGRAAETIAARARECGAQLVVVGAHGEHALPQMLLGTTAEQLLRVLETDLLLVRAEPAEGYARLLLPTDLSAQALAAARRLRQLFPAAASCLLHAYELPHESKLRYAGVETAQLEAWCARAEAALQLELGAFARSAGFSDLPGSCRVVHGHAPRVIAQQAQRMQADLIALSAGEKSALERVVLGSVSLQMAMDAPCDVWVVREAA